MSKSRRVNKQEAVFTKVAKAGKRSVLRSKINERERHEFRQHALRDLVAGVEYL